MCCWMVLERQLMYLRVSKGVWGGDTLAACFVKPAPGVSPPQPSGSGKHTRGGRWRWLLPAETPATSGPPRCLKRIRKTKTNINVVPKIMGKDIQNTSLTSRWPDSTVYLSASCATMLTSPSSREASTEPRSLRKRDSHTRQYCSPHSPRLHHGAWNEPGNTADFMWGEQLSSTPKPALGSEVFSFQPSYKVDTKPVRMGVFFGRRRAARFYVKHWGGLFV